MVFARAPYKICVAMCNFWPSLPDNKHTKAKLRMRFCYNKLSIVFLRLEIPLSTTGFRSMTSLKLHNNDNLRFTPLHPSFSGPGWGKPQVNEYNTIYKTTYPRTKALHSFTARHFSSSPFPTPSSSTSHKPHNKHKISLAPMMEYTDRHLRHLISLVSPSIELWTEMITSPAIVFTSQNDPSITDRLLKNSPLITDAARLHNVIQIGGSDPKQLAAATTIIKNSPHVYTGINLNCGCPSEKVSGKGCFGAALMLDASLVSSCVKAMITAEGSRDLPVSVKCRIGTDDNDDYETLRKFVEEVHVNGGCNEFQVHARVAILRKNFSPADNRNIPPLHYEHVYRLKRDFPHLVISLNGGVDSLSEALDVFENCPEVSERSEAKRTTLWKTLAMNQNRKMVTTTHIRY